jgi:O-antigen ligase
MAHFSACVGLFYLGYFTLRGVRNPWPIWVGLGLALCWDLHTALGQHFGGLEATRQMVLDGKFDLPPSVLANPDYLKRMSSDRVFGTFMYPNSFAAAILLLLPLTLMFLWQATPKLRTSIRGVFVAVLGICGLVCLSWSGSKAGFLIVVVLGGIVIVRSPLPMGWKRIILYGTLLLGLAGFTIQYANSVARGKTSMVARVVYWKAALLIFQQNPVFGSGPGTFGKVFREIKSQYTEWAALCHNDYLEQACDSGIFGFFTFLAIFVVSFKLLYRYLTGENRGIFEMRFGVWLGIIGLFLHATMEFHLYYPALAWPEFFLLGWLWGTDEP